MPSIKEIESSLDDYYIKNKSFAGLRKILEKSGAEKIVQE